jgi:hypothetical protein
VQAIAFIGLNPSRANEVESDMTITKCIGFARRWGFGGIVMVNLYGFVATLPKDMIASEDPVGPGNDAEIAARLSDVGLVVAAWGNSVPVRDRPRLEYQSRIGRVLELAGRPVYCLGKTQGGSPRHPSRETHRAHCCRRLHHCKYGDDNCPVMTGLVERFRDVRHVLRWLAEQGHEKIPRHTPSGNAYRRVELLFIAEAEKRGLSPRELDKQIWLANNKSGIRE